MFGKARRHSPSLTGLARFIFVIGVVCPGSTLQAEQITSTPQHPFYVTNRDADQNGKSGGWIPASNLQPGDHIRTANGKVAILKEKNKKVLSTQYSVLSTQTEISDFKSQISDSSLMTHNSLLLPPSSLDPLVPSSLTTYNFSVADWHTYFVGGTGLWVHNTCPNRLTVDEVNRLIEKSGFNITNRIDGTELHVLPIEGGEVSLKLISELGQKTDREHGVLRVYFGDRGVNGAINIRTSKRFLLRGQPEEVPTKLIQPVIGHYQKELAMEALGARFMVHNHPGGIAIPSPGDLNSLQSMHQRWSLIVDNDYANGFGALTQFYDDGSYRVLNEQALNALRDPIEHAIGQTTLRIIDQAAAATNYRKLPRLHRGREITP